MNDDTLDSSSGNDISKSSLSTFTESFSDSSCGCKSMTNSIVPDSYIYALGRIEFRYPNLAIENEVQQAAGRFVKEEDTTNLTEIEIMSKMLSNPNYRYLIRQLCWVFTVAGIETYILKPRDPVDYDLFIKSFSQPRGNLRAEPLSTQLFIDLIIGVKGLIAPPNMCNGLLVPIVTVDQIYSFKIDDFIKEIPREDPKKLPDDRFAELAKDVFSRIMLVSDNAGALDEHRAINYLAVRFGSIYTLATTRFEENFVLDKIEARTVNLTSHRKLVKVIFSYINRSTIFSDKYSIRVDVTDEFPFLASLIEPYIDNI